MKYSQSFKRISCTLFLLCMLSFSSAFAAGNAEFKKQANVNYLFIQSAGKVNIVLNKKQKNTYTITLHEVKPYVNYFTDRPNRIAGAIPMKQYVELWQQKDATSFKVDPPNANLSAIESGFVSDKILNYVFELKDPEYNAKTKSLTYTAILLEGSAVPKNKVTLKHIILFIDSVCLSCWDVNR